MICISTGKPNCVRPTGATVAAHPVGPLTGWHDLRIREEYTCDAGGNLRAKISADPAGYAREFSIAKAARG
jgi:hypothetical protein